MLTVTPSPGFSSCAIAPGAVLARSIAAAAPAASLLRAVISSPLMAFCSLLRGSAFSALHLGKGAVHPRADLLLGVLRTPAEYPCHCLHQRRPRHAGGLAKRLRDAVENDGNEDDPDPALGRRPDIQPAKPGID